MPVHAVHARAVCRRQVDRGWRELLRLNELGPFIGVADLFEADPDAWRPMYDSLEPHKVVLPGERGTERGPVRGPCIVLARRCTCTCLMGQLQVAP